MSNEGPPARFRPIGFLVVVSGPSGVGKTSFCTHLLAARDDTVRSISVTTRPIRPGEVDGRDYWFVGREEFERRRARGEFLEHAEVHGQLYGTPRSFVEDAVAAGQIVLLNIDVQGGLRVKKLYPQGVFVFLYPPTLDELRRRLEARRQDVPGEIDRRLAEAPAEMEHYREYDYVVENREFAPALAQISAILEAERARVARLAPAGVYGAAEPARIERRRQTT